MRFTIQVLDEAGNWYSNCYIENLFDAMQIARFYRDHLGYSIQLFEMGHNITAMLDSANFVRVVN